MSAFSAFLRLVYEHKEKIILGLLVVAMAGVGYLQFKKKGSDSDGTDGKNPKGILDFKPAAPRKPQILRVPSIANQFSLAEYEKLASKRDIFTEEGKPTARGAGTEKKEWPQIRVKSIFDPTQSGSFIAIIEINKKSRIVKEGERFDNYEIERIDGVRSCLVIIWREIKDEDNKREYCKAE